MYVIVSGPSGSGKSTLAAQLARAMQLPLIAKDTIKESLCDVLEPNGVEESRQLGRAAIQAMLALGRANGSAVLDSVWHNELARRQLSDLPGVVEVFCRCPVELARKRYEERAPFRHRGHFDSDRRPDELWNETTTKPIGGAWPVVQVDTSTSIDLDDLVSRIRSVAAS